MTQCERIVDYLDSHVGITSKEAMEKLGVYRLASRIHDLKASGYEFERITREEVNRYGQTSKFTEYRLKKGVKKKSA